MPAVDARPARRGAGRPTGDGPARRTSTSGARVASRLVGDAVYSAVDAKPKSTLALQRLANIRAQPCGHAARRPLRRGLVDAVVGTRRRSGARARRDRDRRIRRPRARRARCRRSTSSTATTPPAGPVVAIAVDRWQGWSYDDCGLEQEEHHMKHRRLGRTALRVSELCLGTMNFGPLTTQSDAFVIMDHALEHGINFFDTANRYGGDKGPGATETIVGNWFAQGGDRREKVVLATKVFGPMTSWPNDGGLSARHIRAACDASLRRLQTDHIDLYQMHHVDRAAPWDEVWQAMETLVAQGKVVVRRQQQLRGLAHRAGERGRRAPPLPRAGERAEPVQPDGAHDRARSAAGVPRLRPRRDPVEPARRRAARRQRGTATPARRKNVQPRYETSAAAARAVGGVLHASSARSRPRSRSRGCCTRRVSRHRSSGPARSSSSKARRCARPSSSSTTRR